jgi:hypothetical protein
VANVLNSFKSFRAAPIGLQLSIAGPAILIEVVGIILQSIAIDQFFQILEARDKLEAAVREAEKEEVDLKALFADPNGKDELAYFWSKALDNPAAKEDSQVLAKVRAAMELAKQQGFQVSKGQ